MKSLKVFWAQGPPCSQGSGSLQAPWCRQCPFRPWAGDPSVSMVARSSFFWPLVMLLPVLPGKSDPPVRTGRTAVPFPEGALGVCGHPCEQRRARHPTTSCLRAAGAGRLWQPTPPLGTQHTLRTPLLLLLLLLLGGQVQPAPRRGCPGALPSAGKTLGGCVPVWRRRAARTPRSCQHSWAEPSERQQASKLSLFNSFSVYSFTDTSLDREVTQDFFFKDSYSTPTTLIVSHAHVGRSSSPTFTTPHSYSSQTHNAV